MKLKNRFSVLILPIFLFVFGVRAIAEINIPAQPENYVVDLADIVRPDAETALNGYLKHFEQITTVQMIVLTIQSLEGESLEDFSMQVAHERWTLGQKGKDNGVLLLVSLEDRKVRFEVGYGIEGVLTDAYTRRIIDQYIVPYFRQGDYTNGIVSAVSAASQKIASEAGIDLGGESVAAPDQSYPRPEGKKTTLFQKLMMLLVGIGAIYMFIKHPRLFILLLLMNSGGRRGGGGFGGGSFGGGGGSFGGGGGGGFGGGGSSGSW